MSTPEPAPPATASVPIGHPQYARPRQVTEFASVVLCRNPSPMTLAGTNTWVLRAPGAAAAILVDPGPEDLEHTDTVLGHAGELEAIVITHHHADHTAGLERVLARQGVPVYAAAPEWARDTEEVDSPRELQLGGLYWRLFPTPGHSSDSLCVEVGTTAVPEVLLTGDTILGEGTTVLGPEEDALHNYLASLAEIEARGAGVLGLPGHGPELLDVGGAAGKYRRHRLERIEQVFTLWAQLGAGAQAAEIAVRLYPDVDARLLRAAESSTAAAMNYLRTTGAAPN